jgi:hypothetical protein
MGQSLMTAAERAALQAALTDHGISHAGAVQIAEEVPLAASVDRQALAWLMASLLNARPAASQPTTDKPYVPASGGWGGGRWGRR